MSDTMTSKPKVSVLMITYNHEKFIEQAVRSALMQETNFDFELMIGEDCSTDRTREIVLRLKAEFPDKIRLLLHPQNIGMIPNFVATYNACQGKYIALLEGDDYWTDVNKLSKQVRFLDENEEYVLLSCNAVRLERGSLTCAVTANSKGFDFGASEIITRNPCVTLTAMFRKDALRSFPPLYFDGVIGDKPLWILLSQCGRCRYEPEVVGVYRKHSDSITTTWASSYANQLKSWGNSVVFAERWNEYFKLEYSTEVELIRNKMYRRAFLLALRKRDLWTALAHCHFSDEEDLGFRESVLIVFFRIIYRMLLRFDWQPDVIGQ